MERKKRRRRTAKKDIGHKNSPIINLFDLMSMRDYFKFYTLAHVKLILIKNFSYNHYFFFLFRRVDCFPSPNRG